MITTRHRVAVAAAALALLLTGCSGGGGDAPAETPQGQTSQSAAPQSSAPAPTAEAGSSGQTTAEACAIVQESFTTFSELNGTIDASDPQAAVDALGQLSEEASASFGQITNEEVKPAATQAVSALGEYVTFLQTVLSDPSKATEMNGQVTALQEGFTAAATVCAG